MIDCISNWVSNNGGLIDFFTVVISASALITGIYQFLSQRKTIKDNSKCLLKYELDSIKKYVKLNICEDLNGNCFVKDKMTLNIRYIPEWYNILLNCSIKDERTIEQIYKLYDLVYDYNNYIKEGNNENLNIVASELKKYFNENSELLF